MWYKIVKTEANLLRVRYVEDREDGGYHLVVDEIQPEDFVKDYAKDVKTLMQLKEEFYDQKNCLGVVVAGTEKFINFDSVQPVRHEKQPLVCNMNLRLAGAGMHARRF